MALKDSHITGHQSGTDLAMAIGSNLRIISCLALLVGFGTSGAAQPPDGVTDLAKYAMKLPEKQLLRIEPKVIPLPAGNGFRGSGLSDGAGSAISGRNSLVTGSGEYAW